MEINGWMVKKDQSGNYLFNSPLNPKDFYMVTLIKHFAIECSFRKEEIDSIPKEHRDQTIRDKLESVIAEYGKNKDYPWMN